MPEISDYLYRTLIVGGSGSRKTNYLFNLIIHKPDIDKIYLYVKDPHKAKYQFLIKKREYVRTKYLNYSKAYNTRMICKMFINILKKEAQGIGSIW